MSNERKTLPHPIQRLASAPQIHGLEERGAVAPQRAPQAPKFLKDLPRISEVYEPQQPITRKLGQLIGSHAYGAEELVAELGAAFWCAQSAIAPATRHDHASYLAHWVRVLTEHPRVLLTVAARAQAALDYLNQLAGVTTAPATADAA